MSAYRPFVTIAIPTYNSARFIKPTLDSISTQSYENFEVLVVDDGSTDETCEIIRGHGFDRLRIVSNDRNRGCVYTVARCAELAEGEILTYLCHDDLFSPIAVERMVGAFEDPRVGATTRGYYWFQDLDWRRANRVIRPLKLGQDITVTGDADYHTIWKVLETLGQVSGLGFRRAWMTTPFSDDIFTVHIQAFLGVMREHPITYIGDYLVAVRIETSQSRTLRSVYDRSPLATWDEMFGRVFPGIEYSTLRRSCRRAMATENDVGLVQVKCTGGQRALLREIWVSLKLWPQNLARPKFLACVLLTFVLPPLKLRRFVDWMKNSVGARMAADARLAGTTDAPVAG